MAIVNMWGKITTQKEAHTGRTLYFCDGVYDAPRTLNAEIRREVKRAIKERRKVPYSLRDLMEAGIGTATIRKVLRA